MNVRSEERFIIELTKDEAREFVFKVQDADALGIVDDISSDLDAEGALD